MIKLDLSTFVSIHILVTVVVVLILWVFFEIRMRMDKMHKDKKFIWRCNICANIYVDSISEELSKCPICGSLIKRRADA